MVARFLWRSHARQAVQSNEAIRHSHLRHFSSTAATRLAFSQRIGTTSSARPRSGIAWPCMDAPTGSAQAGSSQNREAFSDLLSPSALRTERASRRKRRALHTSTQNAFAAESQPGLELLADGKAVSSKNDETQSDSDDSRIVKRREPPRSLTEYAERKGALSVTDIVSPLWCEFQTQYNVLGLSHLPISQRPTEITTPAGNIVRPSLGATQKREKILTAGRQTHERLEREIFPVQVRVSTTSREDVWALKILQMIAGLKTLMRDGCTRELPVFGFVGGTLVNGIIDEISQRPLPRHILRFLDAPREPAKTGPKLDQFFIKQDESQPSVNDADMQKASSGKRWASQEEWKKDQARKVRSQPSPSKSKRTSPRKGAKLDRPNASQARLASFFAPGSQGVSEGTPQNSQSQEVVFERYGLFIEDSKTRKHGFAPDVQDQKPSRLQCMLYKRLLDGLLYRTDRESHQAPPDRARESRILGFDEFAEHTSAAKICEYLKLDVHEPLSQDFMEGAEHLSEGYGLSLYIKKDGQDAYCNVEHLSQILDSTLAELSEHARRGLGWTEEYNGVTGAIQEQLFLTYRRRKKSKRAKNTIKKDIKARSATMPSAVDNFLASTTLPEAQSGTDSQMAAAASSPPNMDQLPPWSPPEGSQDGSTIPSSSPVQSKDLPTAVESDKDIIARVRFVHSPRMLEAHIRDVLALWRGERELRGVSLRDSWRCWPCAFRDDCEWREAKGRERLDEAAQDRIARVGGLNGKSSAGDSSQGQSKSSNTAPGAAAVAVAIAMAEGEGDTANEAGQEGSDESSSDEDNLEVRDGEIDDDDQLWSQFEDIPTDLAW